VRHACTAARTGATVDDASDLSESAAEGGASGEEGRPDAEGEPDVRRTDGRRERTSRPVESAIDLSRAPTIASGDSRRHRGASAIA